MYVALLAFLEKGGRVASAYILHSFWVVSNFIGSPTTLFFHMASGLDTMLSKGRSLKKVGKENSDFLNDFKV